MITRALHKAAVPLLSGEEDAFATSIVGILLRAFGVQVFGWDGVTIELEVKDEFGVQMPRRVFDRAMALITAMSTDKAYTDVPFFDEMISALSGRGVMLEQDPPSVEDAAWAVTELRLNDPEPVGRDPDQPFSADIRRYLRVVLDDEGFTLPPGALSAAPPRIPGKDQNTLPEDYHAAWASHQEMADAIDREMVARLHALFAQLESLGVDATHLEDRAQAG